MNWWGIGAIAVFAIGYSSDWHGEVAYKGETPGEVIESVAEQVKGYEGFSSTAYIDPVGVPTIGWGITRIGDRPVQIGDKVSEADADKLIKNYISNSAKVLDESVTVELSDNQRKALLSLIYNIGEPAFIESTLLKKLNDGDTKGAAQEFDRWVHGDGEVLQGLVKRREEEKELFLKP